MSLDGQMSLIADLRHDAWAKVGRLLPRPLEAGLRSEVWDTEPRFELLRCDRRVLARIDMRHKVDDGSVYYWFDVTMYVGVEAAESL